MICFGRYTPLTNLGDENEPTDDGNKSVAKSNGFDLLADESDSSDCDSLLNEETNLTEQKPSISSDLVRIDAGK